MKRSHFDTPISLLMGWTFSNLFITHPEATHTNLGLLFAIVALIHIRSLFPSS